MSSRPALPIAACAACCLLLVPRLAAACAVCFSGSDDYRLAFTLTTVFLTVLPLSMISGFVLWLRRKSRVLAERAESMARPASGALPGPYPGT